MSSHVRSIQRVAVVVLFLAAPAGQAAAFTPAPPAQEPEPPAAEGAPAAVALSRAEAESRLTEGFQHILRFFAEREFSLLSAWREMRASDDPDFFQNRYPVISEELDSWAAALEARFEVAEPAEGGLDFSFLLEQFGPVALDARAGDIARDNALATICMVCAMDGLRCEPASFHRFLGDILAGDPSALRKTEALRWWRRTDGFIDEGLIASALLSSAGEDPELRREASRILFSIGTRRSLEAQRLLVSTEGLPDDPAGGSAQIACTAIRHFARARYAEATPELLAALEDPTPEVRACAAESLGVLSGQPQRFDPKATGRGANAAAISAWRRWWTARSAAAATPAP